MKTQEAISILMLSPCYWRMNLAERRELVREFLASYAAIAMSFTCVGSKKKED
jgi:hypothetical protein